MPGCGAGPSLPGSREPCGVNERGGGIGNGGWEESETVIQMVEKET